MKSPKAIMAVLVTFYAAFVSAEVIHSIYEDCISTRGVVLSECTTHAGKHRLDWIKNRLFYYASQSEFNETEFDEESVQLGKYLVETSVWISSVAPRHHVIIDQLAATKNMFRFFMNTTNSLKVCNSLTELDEKVIRYLIDVNCELSVLPFLVKSVIYRTFRERVNHFNNQINDWTKTLSMFRRMTSTVQCIFNTQLTEAQRTLHLIEQLVPGILEKKGTRGKFEFKRE